MNEVYSFVGTVHESRTPVSLLYTVVTMLYLSVVNRIYSNIVVNLLGVALWQI